MAKKFLDNTGLAYLSSKIKDMIAGSGTPIVTGASTDGVAYTATIENLTELTPGKMIILIPGISTSTTTPTLNVNGLGDVQIRRKLSSGTATMNVGALTSYLYKSRPVLLVYDTAQSARPYWMAMEFTKPAASDLYGNVKVENGGTGADNAADARTNLGITPENIGAAPAYTYGTTDLTAGTSALETGKLYFVYE